MTIRWLKHGCQGAVSQQNPDSGDASTLVNGSTQAHLENKELVSYSRARPSRPDITVSDKSTSPSPKAIRLIPESQCRDP
ncbi:hypothetical protein N7471_013825 [Penicillium samsonianum]|uniref:uncharacterized protein n=1 Tax=Penicillium samsonianum TaxID=1882272 RepID=UPI002546F962|nr:uncharacterized protein N7471_013825 [Penicillium samsonianum]KAJ6118358.1 hypothetical protein N7471_013825 [Penicillium samsonianum]